MPDTTETTTGATPETSTETFPEGVGDAGKEAIRREREARRDAERRRTEADKELAALRKKEADREAEANKAAEETARKNGEFEKLANDRASDLQKLTGERDGLKAENDAYAEALAGVLTEREKQLDNLKDAALSGAYPKDASPLERLRWLDDPRTKAAIAASAEDAKVAKAQTDFRAVGQTPRANADNKQQIKPQAGLVY